MTDPKNKKDGNTIKSSEKIGVYICYCGGNISDHVDVEAVRDAAEKMEGVAVARTNSFMCSDPGQELIIRDLEDGLIDRVVVASCAPSLHETTFRGAITRAHENPYIYDHANIREHVSWIMHGDKATYKATKLVDAAVGKAGLLEPLDPIRENAEKHVTVIGGGIAGLKAALALADSNIQVLLIEKTPFLGGNAARLDLLAPFAEKAADLISTLAKDVLASNMITVKTQSELIDFDGYVGNFKLKVQTVSTDPADQEQAAGHFLPFENNAEESPLEEEIKTGAIILATGFKSYQPRTGEYGFGDHKEVITLPELIKQVSTVEGSGMLKLNGRKIRSIGMIHCVGSRQIPGIHEEDEDGYLNEYCSRTCCSSVLFMANTIRERFPETNIYDFYRDIRTYGRGQEELYEKASANKVVFFRFAAEEAPEINPADGDYPLQIKVKDGLTFGEEIEVPVDLVVLATGMEAGSIKDLASMMKLPIGTDKFLQEVHPKLAPVEMSVAGVFLAGTCQAPMTVGETANGATAAAAKAVALLGKGVVELDPYVAEVDTNLCDGTGACVDACLADGALEMVEVKTDKGTMRQAQVVPAFCQGCGACVAVCPTGAIDLKGWSLKQYEAMVDRIVAEEV